MSKSLLTRTLPLTRTPILTLTPTPTLRSMPRPVLARALALTSVTMSVLERMFALVLIFVSARAESPMPPATPESRSVLAPARAAPIGGLQRPSIARPRRLWRELPLRAREPKLCERRFLERDGRQVALKSMSATLRRAPRAMLVRMPGVPMPLLRL